MAIGIIAMFLLTGFTAVSARTAKQSENVEKADVSTELKGPVYKFNFAKVHLNGKVLAWGGALWFWSPGFPFYMTEQPRLFVLGGADHASKFQWVEGTITITPIIGKPLIIEQKATIYYDLFFERNPDMGDDNLLEKLDGQGFGIEVHLE